MDSLNRQDAVLLLTKRSEGTIASMTQCVIAVKAETQPGSCLTLHLTSVWSEGTDL
jgi:hypothetical protein